MSTEMDIYDLERKCDNLQHQIWSLQKTVDVTLAGIVLLSITFGAI